MPVDDVITGATTDALPVAPSLAPTLEAARVPPERSLVDMRVVFISFLAVIVAAAAGLVAQALTRLIGLVTNLAFYGRFSTDFSSPADNHLGAWVIIVPVAGGILVGIMAR
ncbi:MAG: chloride channel protein, partial [Myxococcales bacterium]